MKFVGRGGVRGATGGAVLIVATRWFVGGKAGCSAVSTVVGRSKSLCFWISGPMWLMWLKFVGAEISLRRSDPLLVNKSLKSFQLSEKHENLHSSMNGFIDFTQ